MHFYSFVLKNVIRRRVRSGLTIIGMAVAVGAVVALVGVSNSTERSFMEVYRQHQVAIIVQQRGAKQRLTSVMDFDLGAKIKAIPGVKDVNPGLVDFTSLEELGSDAVVVQGWEAGAPLMRKLDILPGGRLLKADDVSCVLLGERLAEALGKKVGDKIPLFESGDFTVVGVFQSPISYETSSMVLLLPDLQRFMGRQGKVSGFAVFVDHPEDQEEVRRICKEIMELGPRIEAKSADESVSSTTEIRFIRATSWVTSAIAIIIGTVGMLNTMIMSVSERTKEIGILRAIGWRQTRIIRMILIESVLMSLCGGVLGTIGAVGLTRLLGRHPAVAGLIDTRITPEILAFGLFSALCVGLIGAAYPAYRGAQLLPTEALRHE